MIFLTLENYRRLDVITRLNIGKPLAVYDIDAVKEELPNMEIHHGNVGMFKGLVTKVPAEDGYTDADMGEIPYISNYLDTGPFYEGGGPWLDRRKIPRELIYDFIVHHEIAHIIHGDNAFTLYMVAKGALTADEVNNRSDKAEVFRLMSEYRADKYAWSKVCPGQDMPQRVDDPDISNEIVTKAIRNIQLGMKVHQEKLYELELRNIKPISLHPDEYVPYVHKYGVPTFDIKYDPITKNRYPLLNRLWKRLTRGNGKSAV